MTELLAGNTGRLIPTPWSAAIVTLAGAGQAAPPETLEQLTAVQLKPVAKGSLRTDPSPSDGPLLVTVIA